MANNYVEVKSFKWFLAFQLCSYLIAELLGTRGAVLHHSAETVCALGITFCFLVSLFSEGLSSKEREPA